MLSRNYVVIDLETTGVQPGVDEIIEIGAVKICEGKVGDSFQTLVKPRRKLNMAIQRLTGIRDADLGDKPPVEEVLPELLAFTGDFPVVAHNAAFDLNFLSAALGRSFSELWLDTVELSRLTFPLAPNHRLAVLAQYLNLQAEGFHRALNDAVVTASLLLQALDKLEKFDLALIRQLNLLYQGIPGGVSALLRDMERELTRQFPNRLIRESMLCLADAPVAGLFARQSEKKKPSEPSAGEIMAILGPEGPFAAQIPNYQYRAGQLQMLNSVLKAFKANHHLVVEAGTGTGKSLAYLVPAVYWAAAQGEKVVIATHTINLQEQLWEKDIPMLRNMLPLEFSAALVKGRGNYVCLRKWQSVWSEFEQFGSEEKRDLASVLTWLSETLTGDRAELNLGFRGQELWNRFAADSESCLGPRCRFAASSCFVMRARRKAESADVLIVNHSLLLSDIKTDNQVLPAYQYLVIDEAHHLEDSATDHLGSEISDSRFEQLFRLLQRGGTPPGLLGQVKFRLPGLIGKLGQENWERLDQLVNEGSEQLHSLQEGAREFFALLAAFARSVGDQDLGQVRLKQDACNWHGWSALSAAGENLSLRVAILGDSLHKLASGLEDPEDEELAGLVRDLDSYAGECQDLGITAKELLDLYRENQVVWVEYGERVCRLRSAPIEVGDLLRELLFKKIKSGILTSATLAVDNSFEHLLERVGLEPDTPHLQVDSPFQYEEQALICIPRDLPEPASEENYISAVSNLLVDLVRTVQGRTLVLFTSHKMLREVHFHIKPYLEAEDIQVLGHNLDGSRGKLVEEFKSNPRTVLLGASSFWEGVDIQGDALSCVVIIRLPFWPPTMPTIEARIEQLAKQKKDGFRHLSMPQAVIRLKQGFGRLIRTQQDRGVVVILDNRILDKRYGRKFLNSLPLKMHIRGDSELILKKIDEWLKRKEDNIPLRVITDPKLVMDEVKRLSH